MKIRIVYEFDAEDLADWLAKAAEESRKPVTQICRAAGITPQYWYDVVANRRQSVRLETLEKLEDEIGQQYPAEWRERVRQSNAALSQTPDISPLRAAEPSKKYDIDS